jgi:hypothetical protein
MRTVLFFDSFYLNRWENLRRCVGHPEPAPEATFVDPDHMIAVGYPAVFRDEAGKWRCLYQGMPAEPGDASPGDASRQRYPLVAESDDGMSWKIPDLTKLVPLPDRRYPNQVLPAEKFGQWNHYVDERAEDPQQRLKGLVQFPGGKTSLWTSSDGLKWSQVEGVEWCRYGPDTPANAFWNEERQSYVFVTRPRNPHGHTAVYPGIAHPRRYAVSETKDWQTFSEPELALMCDSLDPPLAELYGLPVFPYEGIYIGLMWIYDTVPYRSADPKTMRKYYGGKVDCQLVYSYNGWHFQRTLREPFIPNAPTGQYGAGVLHPTTLMVDDEQSIRIYSSSSKVEHGYHDWLGDWETDLGAILMHRLRLDGFMYLESVGGLGILGTRPLFWYGGELRLNVQSVQEARVQVTDIAGKAIEGYSFGDCEPFSGDELFWQPRWKNGRAMADLSKQVLRVEIGLENARIYAIRGDFLPLSDREARQIVETGEEPVLTPDS